MRIICTCFVLAVVLLSAGIGLSPVNAAQQEQTQGNNQWRYLFYNGEWWYWMPDNHWVYWRDNKWNDYDSRTYTLNKSAVSGNVAANVYSNSAWIRQGSEIGPFYGHAESALDRRSLGSDEIGPFYGRVLPSERFGPASNYRIRPFYGHVITTE